MAKVPIEYALIGDEEVAFGWEEDSGEEVAEGGFAGAGVADEGSCGAFGDDKVEVTEDGVAVGVAEAEVVGFDAGEESRRGFEPEFRGFAEVGFGFKLVEFVDFLGASGAGLEELACGEEEAKGGPQKGLVGIKCKELAEGDGAAEGEDSADEEEDICADAAEEGEELADSMEASPVSNSLKAEGFATSADAFEEVRFGSEEADETECVESFGDCCVEVGEAVAFLLVELVKLAEKRNA